MASPSKPLLIRRASSFHHEQASLPFRRSLSTSRETAEEDDDGALPGIFGINTHLDIAHVDWPDGCAYTGEIDNSVAHGVGVKRSPEGWLYCGQWSHGKENGLGVYLWSDGSWYAGEWTQGQSDGLGVWCSCRRNVYAGDWTQGQKDKLGKQTWGDGGRMVEYIGMWRLGKRAGLGVESERNAVYAGQLSNNKRCGRGKLVQGISTMQAQQQQRQQQRQQQQQQQFEQGQQVVYTGDFKEGAKEGFGAEACGGNTFTGQFKAGHPHGLGMAEKGGRVHRGKWKRGVACKQKFPLQGTKLKPVVAKACECVQDALEQSTAAWTAHRRGVDRARCALDTMIKARAVVCATIAMLESCSDRSDGDFIRVALQDFPLTFHAACVQHYEDTMHAARVSGQPSFMSDMSLSDLQLDAVQLGRLSPVALHASAISLARSCSTLNVDALGSSATHTNDATNYEHNNTNSNSITNSTGPPQLLSTTPWAVEAQQQHRLHSQSVTNLSEGTATTKKLSPTSSTASSSSSSSAAAAQRQRALWNAGLPPPTASLPSVAASAPPLRQRGRVVSNASTRTYKSNTSDTSTASHFSAQSYQPFRQQQQQQRRRQQQRHRRSSQFKSSRLLSAGQLAVLHAAPNARHQSKSKPASSSSAPTSTSSPPSSSTGIAWKRRRRGQSATAPPLPTIPSSSTSSSPQPSVVGSASPARTSQPRQRSSRTRHALSSASSSSLASQSRVLRRLLILAVAFGAFAIVIAIFAALAS